MQAKESLHFFRNLHFISSFDENLHKKVASSPEFGMASTIEAELSTANLMTLNTALLPKAKVTNETWNEYINCKDGQTFSQLCSGTSIKAEHLVTYKKYLDKVNQTKQKFEYFASINGLSKALIILFGLEAFSILGFNIYLLATNYMAGLLFAGIAIGSIALVSGLSFLLHKKFGDRTLQYGFHPIIGAASALGPFMIEIIIAPSLAVNMISGALIGAVVGALMGIHSAYSQMLDRAVSDNLSGKISMTTKEAVTLLVSICGGLGVGILSAAVSPMITTALTSATGITFDYTTNLLFTSMVVGGLLSIIVGQAAALFRIGVEHAMDHHGYEVVN